VLVLVLVAIAVFVGTSRSKDSSTATTSPTTVDAAPMPSGPGAYDDFRRSDTNDGLGTTLNGKPWRTSSGHWGIDSENAFLSVADSQRPRNVAVVDMGSSDGRFRVTMSKVEAGSGLVFRYRNELNYWMLQAAPGVLTWNVRLIKDGAVVDIQNIGLSDTGDGATVEVDMNGDNIEFFVNDKFASTLVDKTLADGRFVGFVAFGAGQTSARWSRLAAQAYHGDTSTTAGGSATTTTKPAN